LASPQHCLQGVLFWGVMSVLLGALGTVGGIIVVTGAVAQAGGAEPGLIWGGVSLALTSLVFGLALFIAAAALWFVLRFWWSRTADPVSS
jgi:biopolymer transport protein ExbB/TolQ